MSDQWQITERRLLELLADREIFGLTAREKEELRQLVETMAGFDTECMERTAAMAQLAFTSVEPLPAVVRAKIRTSGVRHVSTLPRE